jgi:sulfite reductase (NADPH) flavoprotein alpha-component
MHGQALLQQPSFLSDEQLRALDEVIAPLAPDQVAWVAGYLTGLATARRAPVLRAAPAETLEPELTILYGSQSGNGARIADRAKAQALARGFKVRVKAMDEYRASDLKTEKNVLVIVSTHGEGEPPDSAKELYEFLHGRKAARLDETRYSVLALGDASYEHFCKTGRDFDARLQALGAQPLYSRVECDVDYDDAAEAWIEAVLAALANDRPRSAISAPRGVVTAPAKVSPLYSRKNPFPATVVANIDLSGHGSGKEVRHLELSLEGSALGYEPGDALGILPTNDPAVAASLIEALDLDPFARVVVGNDETTLHDALARRLEITTLTRPLVEKYAVLADAQPLRALLAPDRADDLWGYARERQVVDLVREFPVRGLSSAQFVEILRKLPPRLYSIASSHKTTPDEVHATVAAVRYESQGRPRKGVASTFVAERVADGDTVPIYIEVNKNFKLPADPATPIIMVGPGTGVAPFRAFVQERQAIGARGKNWLFFGDRHFTTDFLYQREWQQFLKDGVLTRMDVAFSRDQAGKVYVQHRMKERARDLYAWLQEGAHFYVCGDAERMARDVHQALAEIVAEQGGLAPERAAEYLQDLQRNKRYQRDVY